MKNDLLGCSGFSEGRLPFGLALLFFGQWVSTAPGAEYGEAAATPQLYAVVGGNSRWIEILPI